MKKSLVLFFFILLFNSSFAQLGHMKMGLDRGLPSMATYGLCEDATGMMWVGTDNGVAYLKNGSWKPIQADFIPQVIQRVYPAKDSGVYVVGNNPTGIYKVYQSGEIRELPTSPVRRFSGSHLAYSSGDNFIYYSDWRFIYRTNEKQVDTVVFLSNETVEAIDISSSGDLIVKKSGVFYYYPDGEECIISKSESTAIVEVDSNTFVVNTKEGVNFITDGNISKSIPTGENRLSNSIHGIQSSDKSCWFVGERYGLYQLKKNKLSVISEQLLMPKVQFTHIFMDSQRNLWFSTNGHGLIIIPINKNFENVSAISALTDNTVSKISPLGNNEVMVMTKTGIYKVNAKLDVEEIHPTIEARVVTASEIYALVPLNTDKYLLSTIAPGNKGIYETNFGLTMRASSLLLDRDTLVYGGWGNFGKIALEDIEVERKLSYSYYKNTPFLYSKTTDIEKVDSGYVFTTFGGIFFYENKSKVIKKMTTIAEPQGTYLGLARKTDSSLWAISTRFVYSCQFGSWKKMQRPDEGITQNLTAIEIDQQDRIWLGTENGLILVDGHKTTRVTADIGVLNNAITSLYFDSDNAMLWVGTRQGLTCLDTEKSNLGKPFEYEVSFEAVQIVNGRKCIPNTKQNLDYFENSFTISFNLNAYSGYLKPEYRYRIREVGLKWNYTTRTKIDFFALAPNDYTLEIQSRVAGTYWSRPAILSLSIDSPFWKKGSFYMVLVAVLILLIAVISILRIRKMRKVEANKRALIEKMNRLEIEALNAHLNPHFIFNSLNSIQHYLIPFKNRNAIEYVANLSKLIRLNMQTLGKKRVSLKGELERIKLYVDLEQERYERALVFDVNLDLQNEAVSIWIPPMLIQPIIENAIWHGIMPTKRDGQIILNMKQGADYLFIEIQDNGIGFVQAEKNKKPGHISKGSQLIADRLALYDKANHFTIEEMRNANNNVSGVSVKIAVKIKVT